jgi:NAD(P)-dependent dehydrogenase (short-subunit alcohol dehydrogenase family)
VPSYFRILISIAAIEKETGFTKLELSLLDLSRFASVISFAEKFEQDGGRLDLLVMNAGILTHVYEATPDKWESKYVDLLVIKFQSSQMSYQFTNQSPGYITSVAVTHATLVENCQGCAGDPSYSYCFQ